MATEPYTMKVKGSLDVMQNASITGPTTLSSLSASGDLVIAGNVTVQGGLVVISSSQIGTQHFSSDPSSAQSFNLLSAQGLTVANNSTTGALNVTNGATLNTVTASGAVVLNSTFTGTGSVSLGSAIGTTVSVLAPMTAQNTLGVRGAAVFDANVSAATLSVTNASTLNGLSASTMAVTGNTSLATLSASGAAAFSSTLSAPTINVGTLTASAPAQFNNNVTVSSGKALSLGGALSVAGTSLLTGAVTAASTLSVAGLSTVNGLTVASGNVNLLNTVVTGTLAVTGNISATGNKTVGGTLAVTGAATFNNNVTVASTKTLTADTAAFTTLTSSSLAANGASTLNTLTTTGISSLQALTATSIAGTSLSVGTGAVTAGAISAVSTNLTGALTAASAVIGGAATANTITATTSITTAALSATGVTSLSSANVSGALAVVGNSSLSNVTLTGASTLTTPNLITTGTATVPILNSTTLTTSALTVQNASVLNGLTATTASFTDNVNIASLKTLTTGPIVAGTLSASSGTFSAGVTAASMALTGAATAASATLTGTLTANQAVVNDLMTANKASITTTLSAGSSTLSALTVTGASTLAAVTAGSLSATATTLASQTVTGSSVLAATSVSTLAATGLSSLAAVTATGVTVSGLSALQTVTAAGASLSSLAVSGATILSGTLNAGATTTGILTAANTTVNNLTYNGQLYQGSALLQFAPAGFTMLVPPVNASITVIAGSVLVQLILTPPTQTAFGFNAVLLPAISGINVTVNGTTTLVAFSNTISFFSYAGINSGSNLYGFAPGSTLTAIKLQYVNDVSSSATLTVGNSAFLTAGVPAAPIIAQTSTVLSASITLTAPTVTDSLHDAQIPQPPIAIISSTIAETSSISDAPLATVRSITLPATQLCRPGTVYNVNATVTSAINNTAGAVGSLFFVSLFDNTIPFLKGSRLSDGAGLPVPTVGRFAATNYVSLANTGLTASDVLLGPNWSVIVSNLRSNQEQHPTSTTLPMSTFSMLHSLGATLNQDFYWTDTLAKTLTAQYSTLTCAAQVDSNTAALVGFYKQIATVTLTLAACLGQVASQTVTLNQALKQQGNWGYSNNALSYTTAATIVSSTSNALTFYCDDCVTAPTIAAIAELSPRPAVSVVSVSGIASLLNSASALTVNMSIAVNSIGRFWYPIGTALALTGVGVSTSLTNTVSLCAPIYTDAACTAAVAAGATLAPATTYYRKLAVTISTVAFAALIETLAVSAIAFNIIGSSSAFASSIGAFRYDPLSLALSYTGQRVVFGSATLYPDVTTSANYDQSQSIVGNTVGTVYNTELVVYNGLIRGENDLSWQQNYTTKGYSMSSPFYNYSLTVGESRYYTVSHVLTSSSYNVLAIELVGATGSMTGATVLYKYVDLAGTQTSSWRNVFVPLTTAGLGNGTDGSSGQFQATPSPYKTVTLCPSSSSSVIYVRVVVTATSTLAFKGIVVTDTVTNTILV